ncbi:MAG: histidine kinase [Actinomycetota bacterium]
MNERTQHASGLRGLAWTLFALAALAVVGGLVLTALKLANDTLSVGSAISSLTFLPAGLAFSIVGLLVALRRPENPAGWFMLVIGAFWSVLILPLGDVTQPQWFSNMIWVLPLGLMGTHLLLRLPDGTLPSPRWRWISRASTLAILLAGVALPSDGDAATDLQNIVGLVGLMLLLICIVASVASLFVRARRAAADERHQLRWIAMGGLTFIGFYAIAVVPGLIGLGWSKGVDDVVNTFAGVAYAAVPIGIGIAILKYRLYDIDIVIRKALVFASLAAFFTVVYVLVVGGVGAVMGSVSTPTLSFAAAALVAIGFQPALTRARRFADRVVYGKRSTPYEVLAELGERLGETYAADDVLPRIARVLGEGVGADRADVLLLVEGDFRPVASWPEAAPEAGAASTDADLTVEVRHQGELLGGLAVSMPANDPMDPAKERLVTDLAAQAGLVLRNVRLTEELRSRIDDLQAAQKRLVAAQDDERRRLERNIHDGAQQQLVALTVKLRLADTLIERDPSRARELLDQLRADTNDALEDLRDLARGIYPPLLADKGLLSALEGQARKASLPVEVQALGIDRYPQEIEAAAYFSCLEALQNVAKYAHASRAVVTLSDGDGRLRFEVADDGLGFDPSDVGYGTGLQGMADRLGALAGTLTVTSSVGNGTIVVGTIPVPDRR